MSGIDRERALTAFRAYVAAYGAKSERIGLKVAHTYRVADIAERIARSEGWPPSDIDLAWLCGLLHDLGRFEQLRIWDTFRDADSVSHAKMGAAVLEGRGIEGLAMAPIPDRVPIVDHPLAPESGSGSIDSFLEDRSHDALIVATVEQHSAFRLDPSLDPRTRAFCDVVRDADKVDILRVNCENTPMTVLGLTDGEFLSSGISDAARRGFGERRCLARSERIEPADHLVGMLCFVFELVYPQSARIVREQGHLDALLRAPFGLSEPFRDPATRAIWADMAADLHGWIEERVDGP
ncbi:MAG: HD domain-containing protein [Collinsella sp.]|nr:HD domain-containing protein [Collinsella sp.]